MQVMFSTETLHETIFSCSSLSASSLWRQN